jgi:hypothetical protein
VTRFGALLVCAMFAGSAVDACLFSCDTPSQPVHRSCHDQGGADDGLRVQEASSHCSHDHGAAAFEPILFQKNSRLGDGSPANAVGFVDRWTAVTSVLVDPAARGIGIRPAPGIALNLPLLI